MLLFLWQLERIPNFIKVKTNPHHTSSGIGPALTTGTQCGSTNKLSWPLPAQLFFTFWKIVIV